MRLQLGCVGYSYDFWVGPFYPKGTDPADFLRLYAKVFDLVEIDNTFYRIPQPKTVREWRTAVPPSFLFSAKFPRSITHDRRFIEIESAQTRFMEALKEIHPKAGPLIVQLAPGYTYAQGRDRLFAFLDGLPREFRYAVEFRNNSWMRPWTFDELRKREVALVWNEVEYIDTVPEVTTDFAYLRFIGDRSLAELGSIQIDRTPEMRKWAERLRDLEGRVDRAYVLFNNHFAGYGPGCVDQFRQILDLQPLDFDAIYAPPPGQKSLAEFS